ncbi:MAG: class I SAM-dependent DNA methyltransferase [Flavisolibacter sp.]
MNMDVKTAYDNWSTQYDSNENKTRDLEGIALRECLKDIPFETCLEIGCGTGKNSQWLITKANHVTAVDLSTEMLAKAKEKINSNKIQFVQADITKDWNFQNNYDLVSFSLVLEHIENLELIFEKTAAVLKNGGHVYVGELHPFKQYTGSKARYQTVEGEQVVECYTHHISDFTNAAKKHGLEIVELKEYFDDEGKEGIPRILSLMFKKIDII